MRKLPAILMIIFIVFPLFTGALFTIATSTWVLDRGFYAKLLSDPGLYEIPDAVSSASWFDMKGIGSGGRDLFRSGPALREIVTPQYMMSQSLAVLDSLFDAMNGRAAGFDPSIDLTPIKKALSGEQGRRFAQALAKGLPACKGGEALSMTRDSLPRCRPQSISVDRAAAIIAAGLPALAQTIPDSTRISDMSDHWYSGPWHPWRNAPNGPPLIGFLVMADVIFLILAGAVWIGAAFLGGITQREKLLWLGWSLFAPAAVVFISGIFAVINPTFELVRWGIGFAPLKELGYGAGFAPAVAAAAHTAMLRMGIAALATGAIAAGLAFGLLGVAWSMPRGDLPPSA